MDTPPLLYKSVNVTFVFWVPKTPPHPIHVRHFCVSPPPPPVCMYVSLLTSNFIYIGAGKLVAEMGDFGYTGPSLISDNFN